MRYFVGFLAAIALIMMVFILVLRGLGGRAPQTQVNMLDFASTGIEMRLLVDGPVNADQLHQSYQITVGRDSTSIEVFEGYQGVVTQQRVYPNNREAYAAFLRSLQLLNYTKGDPDKAKADERGNCSDGSRYVYEIVGNAKTTQRFWSTSCGGGTFHGNASKVRVLFDRQVPDFFQLTKNFIQG